MTSENLQKLRDLEGYLADPDIIVRVFEAFPDAVVVVDENGLIQLVNTQAELMFGYHRKELFDKPVEILLPEEKRERHVQHRVGFFGDPKARPMGLEMRLKARRKDGTEFVAEINLSPIPSQNGLLAAAVIRKRR
jgi:PAS domain S-box-containing protein